MNLLDCLFEQIDTQWILLKLTLSGSGQNVNLSKVSFDPEYLCTKWNFNLCGKCQLIQSVILFRVFMYKMEYPFMWQMSVYTGCHLIQSYYVQKEIKNLFKNVSLYRVSSYSES